MNAWLPPRVPDDPGGNPAALRCAEPSTGRFRVSSPSCGSRIRRTLTALGGAIGVLGAAVLPFATAEVRVAPGLRVEVVVTGITRPVELAFDASGRLVVLSHGCCGEAAGELHWVDLTGSFPVDASRVPRVVIPFPDGPSKNPFGSLAVDPRSEELFLGEENGSRIYRLTAEHKLALFAVGLHHLVGGGSLAFDGHGRLVVLDFASPTGRLGSELPPPSVLEWLEAEAYQGPLVFRVDPRQDIPRPRKLDLVTPIFPKVSARPSGSRALPRFVSVAVSPADEILLLGSLGEVFQLTPGGGLQRLARLPAGHYHRTHMALEPDGGVLVAAGFHIRQLYRISPAGTVSVVASELGDPGSVVADQAGNLYIAETALHRIIRIRPAP